MAGWFPFWLGEDEGFRLREILSQTASPGSLQSQLIQRLDASLEESKRPRFGREKTYVVVNHPLRGGH